MVRVVIDSRKRQGVFQSNGTTDKLPNSTSRVDYVWKTSRNINKIQSMILKHVQVPKHPTVITSYNDTFRFTEDTGAGHIEFLATIPQGYYTASTLASALGTAMTTISAGSNIYTASWDSTTNKMTVTDTGGGAENYPWAVDFSEDRTEIIKRTAYLFGASIETAGAEQTSPDNFTLPYEAQMNSPRYYTLSIEVGNNGAASTLTDTRQFSFVIPAESSRLYEVITETENGDFRQSEPVTNGYTNEFRVKWYLESDKELAPEWNNLDHIIVIELVQSK